jgi:hypothetical protein
MISCGVYGTLLQNLLPAKILGYAGRSEKLDLSSSIQGTGKNSGQIMVDNVEVAALRQKSSETLEASVPTFVVSNSILAL